MLILEEAPNSLMELAEVAKLTALIREKNTPNFASAWKRLLNFVLTMGKNETLDFAD